MKVRELIAVIESDGWLLVRTKGSHRQFQHPTKPGTVTVAGNLGVDVPQVLAQFIANVRRTHRRSSMWGSALYGFILGVGALLVIEAAPQPAGSVLWWGFVAGQLTWGAALCWRRTGLPFATGAMAIAAATASLLAVLAAVGHIFPDLPRAWWAPVAAGVLAGPLLLLVESRVHQATWKQWKEYMERKNAWDILVGRHIPNLRDGGA